MSEQDVSINAPNPVVTDNIDLSGDGGVLKRIIKIGENDATPHDGCKVSLHYTGTLTDGTKFDSSRDTNTPFEFEIGKGMVIKAFDLGVASMKKGEKAVLTCAPSYAYGAAGSPPKIPPNSTLIFELELINWKAQDLSPKSDGGIERHIITKSEKRKTPGNAANVQVHITGKYDGRIFDDRDVSFDIGEVPESEVISGIQHAIQQFGRGETSRLVIQPQYAFGTKGNVEFKIPPNATVEYICTLTDFEKEVQSWTLAEEESLQRAKLYKEKGTSFLKKEDYKLAIKLYEKSNSFLSSCKSDESKLVKAAVFLNIALCHQKLNDNFEVKQACNTVLELDPKNVKALYRRGVSSLQSGETDGALADLTKLLEIEPENKAAYNQVIICKQIIRESHEKEKKLYANMFTKFATVDKEKLEKDRNEENDVLSSCGEWNMEEEARKEANRVFEEVDQNVVMI